MKPKLFIDGEHGTTGLQIRERLSGRDDLEILSLPVEARRDEGLRREMLGGCDFAILCLPDDAAREAVELARTQGNDGCRFIDTSTAHRVAEDWVFGFAELDGEQTARITNAGRVSNPGCYSTGAIALIKPLIDSGMMSKDLPVSINAVSGYTGGGKALIAQMEDDQRDDHIETAFHAYALGMKHKHVPEIMVRSGLEKRPIFIPSVGRFRQGMLVSIPLFLDTLKGAVQGSVREVLEKHYEGREFVNVASAEDCDNASHIRPEDHAGRDDMRLWVFENRDAGHVNLIAQLDNLGKGASGAAVQNLNLMLGQARVA